MNRFFVPTLLIKFNILGGMPSIGFSLFPFEMLMTSRKSDSKYDETIKGLEMLRSTCSRFAFESFIKPQADLIKSGFYEVFENSNNTYNIMRICDQSNSTNIVHLGTPSICTCMHPQHTRTPCQHIIVVFNQLPNYHHSAFASLMQQASEYVTEHGKTPELPKSSQMSYSQVFLTQSILPIHPDENKKSSKKCANK
ncbi:25921_t:CDS:2 [Gigaspora rosea]|nr:25921_t:CDS:2 [Gigaspora rosea]